MAGYRGGHILRIHIKNFMTYDDLELYPKPGLNLIVGLNGSGKSSIMCAICLGLGGKPTYTGRSAQLSDFVKYGCDKATIVIELENPSKRNVMITRVIQGEKSTWFLYKDPVSLHEIQNVVKKFNIDVSNLCQFLPQEKVTEFSKMDKKQRLENLLQAIGEPRLFTLFKELKNLKTDSLKVQEQIKRQQNHKDSQDQVNQRLKVDVDKHEEKLRMKEHLKSLKQHKMILDYNDIRAALEEIKKDIKPLKQRANIANTVVGELRAANSSKSKVVQEACEKMKKIKVELIGYQEQIASLEVKMHGLHEKADNAKIHYQNRLEEKKNQKTKLSEIAKQKQALMELHQKNLLEKPELKEKDDAIASDLDSIANQMASLTSTLVYTNLKKNNLQYSIKASLEEIDKMKNEEEKKLQFLKQRFIHVYEACIWLYDNRARFKATVHLPMFLTLNVQNDDNRKYIENFVMQRDLIAFICEDKEDNKLLTQILRVQKNLNVNIVMVPDKPIEYYASVPLSSELRNLGVQCFMKDIFEAPDAVMRFLCQCYNLHRIPLCLPVAEQNANYILQKFSLFFTPEARISGKRSKYGDRNFSTRRDALMPKNFLPSSKDHSERLKELLSKSQTEKAEMDKLVSKIQSLGEQIKNYERRENTMREEKKYITEKLNDFFNIERQLQQKIQSFEQKKHELIDEEYEKTLVTKKIREVNLEKIRICGRISTYLENFIPEKKEKLQFNLQARLTSKALESVRNTLREKEEELKTLEVEMNKLNTAKQELVDKGKILFSQIQIFLPTDEEEKQEKISSLGKMNRQEVEKEIRSVQAQLDLNCEENEAIVAEYNEREKRIAETQKEIDNLDKKLNDLQDLMKRKKDEWLPALSKHIKNINSKFSQYYKQLKCAGEISLDTINDTDDFLKYGLQLTLKYRDNEPFMELSNTHHSGGECSVAAIIFILSLQELTEVPFRCIDEINQGMDSQNERNIYSLIADSAKSGTCSQYFLLTPKLLMDLEMIEHQDVAVHIIYNSCFLEMKLDVKRHIALAEKK